MHILDKIKDAREQLNTLVKQYNKIKSNRTLVCARCGAKQKIREIELIDKQAYRRPSGCTEGDYWYHDEYGYACLKCEVHNRFLFNDSYEHERDCIGVEAVFFRAYADLFSNIARVEESPSPWINNYYVRDNFEKFIEGDALEKLTTLGYGKQKNGRKKIKTSSS